MHYYLREWGLDVSKSHAFVMSTSPDMPVAGP